jgi:hypothetical protein
MANWNPALVEALIPLAAAIASLREKYGKEAIGFGAFLEDGHLSTASVERSVHNQDNSSKN